MYEMYWNKKLSRIWYIILYITNSQILKSLSRQEGMKTYQQPISRIEQTLHTINQTQQVILIRYQNNTTDQ